MLFILNWLDLGLTVVWVPAESECIGLLDDMYQTSIEQTEMKI